MKLPFNILLCFFCCCIFLLPSCDRHKTLFHQLSSAHTNVEFNNQIFENDSVNILDFSNIYNGGGVGVGDFNNDGLQDLYFTGNMVSNKLYLNKGDFQFQDITTESHTDGNGEWCRGVAVVDINNDGKLDMYVCATAKKNPLLRKNILYINQGNDANGVPVFKDMAREYGLDDTTQSTMAYFFDYDNDGDLDLYIAVNHISANDYPNHFRKRYVNGENPSTGKLYRNDWNDSLKHPVFTDVSKQAGILVEGYSHAADIFDANNDGWPDILVTNDYLSNNVLYINNRDGTFKDSVMQYFKHTAANSMGSDAVDINNDGLDDVVEVDMLPEDNYRKKVFQNANNYYMYQSSDFYGYQYQYVRNMLQLNQGPSMGERDSIKHPVFSDVGFFAGIAETDWSWTPLVADYDNDGKRDILYTNGFPKDITDHDFASFRQMANSLVSKKDMLAEIPSVKIHNYIFKNNGGLKFTDKTDDWGFDQPSFSNGAVYVDLDNDGDLDVVVNNIDDPAMIYENRDNDKEKNRFLDLKFIGSAKNVNGIGARVVVHQKDSIQAFTNNPYRGYLSSVSSLMHFGLGNKNIDSVEIFWPGSLRQVVINPGYNKTINVNIKDAISYQRQLEPMIAKDNLFTDVTSKVGIDYVSKQRDYIDFNIQKLLPHKFSQYSPGLAVGDVNGDGLDDFVIGGAPGSSAIIFKQMTDGKFIADTLISSPGVLKKKSDDRGILLFDADGDGDLDLYISAGGYIDKPGNDEYSDVLYVNDGKGHFIPDSTALPFNTGSKFCVRACDYDKDGDLDLFIAGRVKPWNYPEAVSSFIYRNDSKDGKIKFTDVTASVAPALANVGLTCDAIWTDFDNDGWQDLILAGEWMPLKFLKNDKGHFKDVTATSGISNKTGWWNSIIAGDFDNDGDIDYIVGNLGENSFYKASAQYPVSIYAKDFDKNGVLECIPTKYIKDKVGGKLKEFTVHTRDDIVDQMPFIKKKFLNYKSFGTATFDQLFTPDQMKDMMKYSANYLESSFIRNNGNGTFTAEPLPDMAQFSVINGMVIDDFDGDGNLDVLINGNDYGTEVSTGRYDASNGLLLKGDGKGSFIPLSILQSGIFIPGDGKAMVKLRSSDGKYLLAASQNKGPLKIFELKKNLKTIQLEPGDVSGTINYKNGVKRKWELGYGASFLSQSGRFLKIDDNVSSVEIYDSKGKSRRINF
ncbi:MAG TPA: VCBS repeat-containing protein [Chitinophagaceae bacterium]